MPRDIEDNIFHANNYINQDQFNQFYDPAWQIKKTWIVNIILQKLIAASKKLIESK